MQTSTWSEVELPQCLTGSDTCVRTRGTKLAGTNKDRDWERKHASKRQKGRHNCERGRQRRRLKTANRHNKSEDTASSAYAGTIKIHATEHCGICAFWPSHCGGNYRISSSGQNNFQTQIRREYSVWMKLWRRVNLKVREWQEHVCRKQAVFDMIPSKAEPRGKSETRQ